MPAPQRAESSKVGYSEILHHVGDTLKIFRVEPNPRIYVFDFPNLRTQGLALNRIAGLVEKQDLPGDRVIRQSELDAYFANKHVNPDTFYFGHNYNGVDVAEFFNLVARDGLELNPGEADFLRSLLRHGILVKHRKIYKLADPPVVILSISQPQDDNPNTEELDFVTLGMRCTILRHELSHGEWSTNARYRRFVRDFWRHSMNNTDRQAFRAFLSSKGYDDQDQDLMANEMQAYLMHSPNPRAFSAERVGIPQERIDELRRNFLKKSPSSWTISYFFPKNRAGQSAPADLTCNF